MKKLKTNIFFMVCIVCTIQLSAKTIIYQKYDNNSVVIEKPNQLVPEIISVHGLNFSYYNSAYITDERAKVLLDSGSVEVSREIIKGKGKYSNIIFTFTPMYKIHRLVIINSNNDVRSIFSEEIGDPIISVWFLFSILCIVCMALFQFLVVINGNTNTAAVVAAAAAGVAAAGGVATAAKIAGPGAGVAAVGIMLMALLMALGVATEVKRKNDKGYTFFLIVCYVFIGIFIGMCYKQA